MTTTAVTPATSGQDRAATFAAMRAGDIGSVHSWELVTAVDGPGTRMTLFLAGCVLRCKYCHNPDTWKMRDGVTHTVDEVMERITRYQHIFKTLGGGVTISGGEPLMQPAFVAQIFRRCQELGIHTTIDTSGFLGTRASDQLLADTDLVLLDVKSGDPDIYREVTGVKLEPTLAFGRRLAAQNKPIWIRFVLVPDLTDGYENVEAVAEYAASLTSVERVEVLPFHQMGRDKWQRLGLKYELEETQPPSAELVARVQEQFRSRGLTVY
ncbi:MAG TPA: pyruvate formate-lyase-activating protein [Actinomycetales bacterium]|nr:pyruvate formate-lyase-activating protein [Actinomycetales bacterium]